MLRRTIQLCRVTYAYCLNVQRWTKILRFLDCDYGTVIILSEGTYSKSRGGVRWGCFRLGFWRFEPTYRIEHPSEGLNSSYPIRKNINETSDVLLVCFLVCRNEKHPRRGVFACCLAEKEGFEPSIRQKPYTGFRVQRIRPLCHFSGCQPNTTVWLGLKVVSILTREQMWSLSPRH